MTKLLKSAVIVALIGAAAMVCYTIAAIIVFTYSDSIESDYIGKIVIRLIYLTQSVFLILFVITIILTAIPKNRYAVFIFDIVVGALFLLTCIVEIGDPIALVGLSGAIAILTGGILGIVSIKKSNKAINTEEPDLEDSVDSEKVNISESFS